MSKLYKLTNSNHCTHNNTKWGKDVQHTARGNGLLCTSAYLHAYTHPLLAVFLASIHDVDHYTVLWEADGDVEKTDGLKVGCTRLKTIRTIPIPKVTDEQWVRFAIFCALTVCDDPIFTQWAERWLDGTGRSEEFAFDTYNALLAGSKHLNSIEWLRVSCGMGACEAAREFAFRHARNLRLAVACTVSRAHDVWLTASMPDLIALAEKAASQ